MSTKIARPSAATAPSLSNDINASQSQEHRTQATKIKVGTYSGNGPKKQGFSDHSQATLDQSAASVASSAAKAAISTASTTLFDLCDSSYSTKHCVRGRKRKSAGADDKSSSEIRIKTLGINSSSSSSSSSGSGNVKTQRAKDQCGMGPRVEIVNGKIIVRESSLMVSQESSYPDGDYEEVVEGNHATATYSSFLKSRHAFSWGMEETRLFYQCLRQCGTEFSIMQSFFPGRTRKQLRSKFFREEKSHPELVKIALTTTLPLEIIPFEPLQSVKKGAEVERSALRASNEDDEDAVELYDGGTSAALNSHIDDTRDEVQLVDAQLSEMISDDDEGMYDV